MSDDDSGVDAGSDSNGSLSMSVGSSAPSENDPLDIEHHMAHIDEPSMEHPPEASEDLPIRSPTPTHPNDHQLPSTSRASVGCSSFEMSWPAVSISGDTLNSSSYHFHHYDYSNPIQHDFQPKMKTSHRKEAGRFYSIVNNDITAEKKLRIAASNNDHESIRKLLDEGVNPKCCDSRLRTPLHLAACKGYTIIATLLLESGADPNQKDIIGNTPLHLAACTNHTSMVTLLLKAGTNINSIDNSGRTPLHLAQSKLKILKQTKATELNETIREEVLQVVEMMQVYLQRSGKVAELDVLSSFTNRLHQHTTKEEMDIDVEELLNSLDHLSLKRSV